MRCSAIKYSISSRAMLEIEAGYSVVGLAGGDGVG